MKMILETLEDRIAPAGVVTYTDVDGDLVTVKSSKGTSDDLFAALTFSSADPAAPRQLQNVDLSTNAVFADTNLTITAKRTQAGGDGFVNVGRIDASDIDGGTAIDLGSVKIDGDLGRINAGDSNIADAAMKSLAVQSMGRMGISTGANSLFSIVTGGIGKVAIAGDFFEASLVVNGDDASVKSLAVGGSVIGIADGGGAISVDGAINKLSIRGDVQGEGEFSGNIIAGTLGKAVIGGSIIGGSGLASGNVGAIGFLNSLVVKGDVRGGLGDLSGAIQADSGAGSIVIGGSMFGDAGDKSGTLLSIASVGSIKITGDLVGGGAHSANGLESGRIGINGDVNLISIGGSMIGGTTNSGSIAVGGDAGSILIGRDIRGGTANIVVNSASEASGSGFVNVGGDLSTLKVGGSLLGGDAIGNVVIQTGGVHVAGDLGSAVVGGSLIAGSANGGSGALQESGALIAEGAIGKLTIEGSIVGGANNGIGGTNRNNGIVFAGSIGSVIVEGDLLSPNTFIGRNVIRISVLDSIGSLNIGGSVSGSFIQAGFNLAGAASNADAQIGKVTIGGNWIASSLAAGINPVNAFFGDANDVVIATGDDPAVASRIASILIKGQVSGTVGALFGQTDAFGFTAQLIGSFQTGKTKIFLADDQTEFPVGATGDTRIHIFGI